VKAKYDDHVITVRPVVLPDGEVIPTGTHGFVIEALENPTESYEIEFYVEHGPGDDLVLVTVSPDDFGFDLTTQTGVAVLNGVRGQGAGLSGSSSVRQFVP